LGVIRLNNQSRPRPCGRGKLFLNFQRQMIIMGFKIIILILVFSTNAYAGESGFYVSGNVGMLSTMDRGVDDINMSRRASNDYNFELHESLKSGNVEIDTGIAILAEIGMKTGKSFRVGLEYGYRNSNTYYFKADQSSYQQDITVWDLPAQQHTKDYIDDVGNPYVRENGVNTEAIESTTQGNLDVHSLIANFSHYVSECVCICLTVSASVLCVCF